MKHCIVVCFSFSVLQKCVCDVLEQIICFNFQYCWWFFTFLVPNLIYYNLLYYWSVDNNLVIKSKKKSNCFSIIKKNKNTNKKFECLRDTSFWHNQFLFLFLLNCINYFKILDYVLIIYTMKLFKPFYGMLILT